MHLYMRRLVMKIKILIIDNNKDFRSVLRLYLEGLESDFEIQEANSGEMALAHVICHKPDIILMDIHLPRMHGLSTAKKIKDEHPDGDIVMLTMFESEALAHYCPESGITAFVSKSEIYEHLGLIIQEFLTKRLVMQKVSA